MRFEDFQAPPTSVKLFESLALDLLPYLDPETFTVNASGGGIVIYRRTNPRSTLPWERKMWEECKPLPADWTGWLSRTLPPPKNFNENSSGTGRLLFVTSPAGANRGKARGAGSSKTQSRSRKSGSN